jgi:glutamyl-tRNA reductase
MTLIAIGLNHRSAPLSVLEQVTIAPDDLAKALSQVAAGDVINEAVVLSTCNRVEIFVHAERFHDAYHHVRDALALLSGLAPEKFIDHLYVHYDDEATEHLFQVTAGLDSAILGEHEIQGQVRTAWDTARSNGTSGPLLNPVFEHAVAAGRRVRTETAIGRRTASLSQAAVNLISEHVGSLEAKRVLLVGAGEVGQGVAQALQRTAPVSLTVCNRTHSTGADVAAQLGAAMVPMTDLQSAIAESDVVITATGAPSAVITREMVDGADLSGPVLVLDLAVPRDVDPDVIKSSGVDLLVLSDLQNFANRGVAERQEHFAQAREVLDEELSRYRRTMSEAELEPLLGSLHRSVEAIRRTEVERYGKHLGGLTSAQVDAVESLTSAIVSKILHEPSSRLRDSAGSPRAERLAQDVRELFDL